MGWERFGTDNRRILTTTNQDGQKLFDSSTAWNKQEWVLMKRCRHFIHAGATPNLAMVV
jgi:hypothetical protein